MKYLKYNALLVALLAFNVVLWGQEPCTDLPVKPTKGEVIQLPTIIAPHTDVQSPLDFILTCPANQSINLGAGATTATVTWDDPTGITTCNFGGLTINQSQGAASGASFSEGTHTIEYQATDNCGNTAVCNFTVWVGHYDPTVIFVHGLGGNSKSWLSASQWQEQQYQSQEVKPQYIQDSGLESAGFNLNENLIDLVHIKMETVNADITSNTLKQRNFIIAHSQGGVVSQVMEKYIRGKGNWENRYYGGLVTFGTPHQGAYIMNSLIEDHNGNLLPLKPNCKVDVADSRVGDFVHDAEDALLPALIAEKVKAKDLPVLFGTQILSAVEGVAKALADPIVLKYLIGGTAVNCTTRGFAEGSSDIFGLPDYQMDDDENIVVDANGVALDPISRGGLNTFFEYSGPGAPVIPAPLPPLENTIPKVAFYGEINDESTQGELLWRVGFWQDNSVNSDNDGIPDGINGFGLMGANMPQFADGQVQANKHKADYYAEAESHRLAADELWKWKWWMSGVLNLIRRKKAKLLYRQSSAFRKGAMWYETANNEYKTLIGAKKYEIVDACKCQCKTGAWGAGGSTSSTNTFSIPCSDDCGSHEFYYDYGTYGNLQTDCKRLVETNSVTKQSDGVVLAESAANMAGATVNENTPGFTKDDFVMYGSIHMQMRNDENLEIKLKKLYTGYYDDEFHLYPK